MCRNAKKCAGLATINLNQTLNPNYNPNYNPNPNNNADPNYNPNRMPNTNATITLMLIQCIWVGEDPMHYSNAPAIGS